MFEIERRGGNHRGRKTHHCPICDKPAKVRCETQEHLYICKAHYKDYRPGNQCIMCREAERRLVTQERKEAEKWRLKKENEKKAAPTRKGKTKARCPEKMKRKQEKADAANAIESNGYNL